jgi:hypothetical protein
MRDWITPIILAVVMTALYLKFATPGRPVGDPIIMGTASHLELTCELGGRSRTFPEITYAKTNMLCDLVYSNNRLIGYKDVFGFIYLIPEQLPDEVEKK